MGSIGIDLGLKESATTSNGDKLTIKQTQKWANKLAVAQRASNKKRVKAIHAKIKNTRLDLIHKFTTKLVQSNALIVVGDVIPILKNNTQVAPLPLSDRPN